MLFIFFITLVFIIGVVEGTAYTLQVRVMIFGSHGFTMEQHHPARQRQVLFHRSLRKTRKRQKHSSTLHCIYHCRERLHLHFCFSEVMANFYVPLHTKHTQLSSSNLDQRREASPRQYMRFGIIQNWQKSQVPSAWHDI